MRRMIARTGEDGITRGVVDRRLKGAIDERRLNDIFETLQRAGEIRLAKIVSDSGQKKIRYWAPEHLPEGAQPV